MEEIVLMPIEVPKSPKVYTTTYDNFKGVDFTNDSTNIWRRRSPEAVNMLPDESGRPFKRHGWEILLTNAQISSTLGVDACAITKCSYFELGGVDHIVIFTDAGVVFYNGTFTAYNKDYDCYSGYDRCFFFEGNGTSAFYIYGNYRMWRYDSSFQLNEITDILTVPRVLVAADGNCTGTMLEGYNLLGVMASIEYNGVDIYSYWCSDGLGISVPDGIATGNYCWEYNHGTSSWDVKTGYDNLTFTNSNISVYGTIDANESYEIRLVVGKGVMLPNNVTDKDKVKVWASTNTQFDTPLTVLNTGTPSSGQCLLITDDTVNRQRRTARIMFSSSDNWQAIDPAEDFIKVEFPSLNITITDFDDPSTDPDLIDNGQAQLVVEVNS